MKQISSVVMLVSALIAVSSLTVAALRGTRTNENAEKNDSAQVAPRYPPLNEYLMPRDAEMALAESAAPTNISGRATIKLLTAAGFQTARAGNNGFVCMVMRGWSAPTYTPAQIRDIVYDAKVRAPICFDAGSARTVMPYYELRHKLGIQGKTPDQIAEGIRLMALSSLGCLAAQVQTEADKQPCNDIAPGYILFVPLREPRLTQR